MQMHTLRKYTRVSQRYWLWERGDISLEAAVLDRTSSSSPRVKRSIDTNDGAGPLLGSAAFAHENLFVVGSDGNDGVVANADHVSCFRLDRIGDRIAPFIFDPA